MKTENNISHLRTQFSILEKSKNSIVEIFSSLNEIIENLTNLYKEIIRSNNNSKLLIICLDTFHFQKVLLRNEYKSLQDFYNIISNRVYCDFYKLSSNIISYIKTFEKKNSSKTENNILKKVEDFKKYPVYDDLNINKEYNFNDITNLYNDILDTLVLLSVYVSDNNNVLNNYKKQSDIGLNLDNFIYSYESNVHEIENKINLFCNYTSFFIDSHNKYYTKFLTRIMLTYTQVSEDIRFDEDIIHRPSKLDISISEKEKQIESVISKTLSKTNHLIDEITKENKAVIPERQITASDEELDTITLSIKKDEEQDEEEENSQDDEDKFLEGIQ